MIPERKLGQLGHARDVGFLQRDDSRTHETLGESS